MNKININISYEKCINDLLVKLQIIENNISKAIQSYFDYKYLKNETTSYSLLFLYNEKAKIIASIKSVLNILNDRLVSKHVDEHINNNEIDIFDYIDASKYSKIFDENKVIYLKTWGGLGDCLLHTLAIRSIKNKFPDKILKVFCVNDLHYQILVNNPYIDEFVDSSTYNKNKVSFLEANYSELLPFLLFKQKASEIICFILLQNKNDDKLDIFLTMEEVGVASEELSKYKTPVTINPCSACSKNQEWDLSKWRQLIFSCNDIDFIQIGKKDEPLIEGCKDYRGLTIRECIAILGSSKALIGMDSFWNHVAHALGVKSIVLFGDSSPMIWGHANNINLYKDYDCSICIDILFGRDCPYGNKCMDDITVNDVQEPLNKIVNELSY